MQCDPVAITSGVPQGSIIGPVAYKYYTSDLVNESDKSIAIKFADDTAFVCALYAIDNTESLYSVMQYMKNWSSTKGLTLNTTKTKMLVIKRASVQNLITPDDIDTVTCLRYLGVFLNESLTWDSHVHHIVRLCSRRLYGLRILKS